MTMKSLAALVLGVSLLSSVAMGDVITSVSQLKDVPKSEPYFEDIESLVERYGIIEQATYRPTAPISKGEFAMMLAAGLDRFSELVSAANVAKSPLHFPTPTKSASQYSDVKPSDTYYDALNRLSFKYGINFGSKDGQFHATESVTQQQAAGLFKMIFGITTLPSANQPLTRGEMAMFLNSSLNYAADALEQQMTEK